VLARRRLSDDTVQRQVQTALAGDSDPCEGKIGFGASEAEDSGAQLIRRADAELTVSRAKHVAVKARANTRLLGRSVDPLVGFTLVTVGECQSVGGARLRAGGRSS
jgi:hypothetical protein